MAVRFIFLFILSISNSVFSQDFQGSKIKLKDLKPKTTSTAVVAPASAPTTPSAFFGQIRLESMEYTSEIPEAPHLTHSQLLSARVSGVDNVFNARDLYYGADITAGTYFSWNQSHYFINELYLKYALTEVQDLSLGRKKYLWSELDTTWQLGLWQPKFTLDALRPEDQGLTGLFYSDRQGNSEVVVMGTVIFIPTMGPEIREEGSSLVSDSRWYRSPSNKWNFNGQQTSITYKLNTPDIGGLAAKPAAAAMYRFGDKTHGPRFGVGAAYKPVNDLLLKYQSFQVITETKVTVSPDVVYHELYSADAGYSWGAANISGSYITDRPEVKRPENEWVIQKLSPVDIYSAGFGFELDPWVARPLQIQTSYLRAYGGGIQDIESDGGQSDSNLFDSRMRFTNAAMVRLLGEMGRPYSKPVLSKFGYIYDFDQKGSIWSLEFQVYPYRSWGVVVGADLLGVEEETNTDKRFINQFRANDRYYGGMSYVF